MVGGEQCRRECLRISMAFGRGPAQPGLPGRGNDANVGAAAIPGAPAFRDGVLMEQVGGRRRSEVANPVVRVRAEFAMRRDVGVLYPARSVVSGHYCHSSVKGLVTACCRTNR